MGHIPAREAPIAGGEIQRAISDAKSVSTESGALPLATPSDRERSFAAACVTRGMRRLTWFDTQLLSHYRRGLTVRAPQAHLEACYVVPLSTHGTPPGRLVFWDRAVRKHGFGRDA